jgi:hypothetical protein
MNLLKTNQLQQKGIVAGLTFQGSLLEQLRMLQGCAVRAAFGAAESEEFDAIV